MKKVRVWGDRNTSLIMALQALKKEERELIRKYIEIIPADGYPLVVSESPKDVEEE